MFEQELLFIIKIKKTSLRDLRAIYNLNVDLAKYELKFDPLKKKPQEKRQYHYGYNELREKIKKRGCQFFIAEDRKKPIGFVEGCIKKTPPLYKYSKRGEIGPTFVKKEYQKKALVRN